MRQVIDGFRYDLYEWNLTAEVNEMVGLFSANEIMHLHIPAYVEYDGMQYKVVGIQAEVFKDKLNVFEILLPSTLRHIGENAFKNSTFANICRKKSPNALNIAKSAFENCRCLQSVTFGGKVMQLGSCAFKDCVNLEDIDSQNIECRPLQHAFENCIKLKHFSFRAAAYYEDSFSGVKFDQVVFSDYCQKIEGALLNSISDAIIHCSSRSRLKELAYEGYHILTSD